MRVDAGRLAASLGVYGLDPEALACWPHGASALRVNATLRDGLGDVSLYVPALAADDIEDE